MRIRQNGIALLAALGLGATAMYFLDPRRGQVRRNEAQGRGGSRLRGAGRGIRLTGSLLRDRSKQTTTFHKGLEKRNNLF